MKRIFRFVGGKMKSFIVGSSKEVSKETLSASAELRKQLKIKAALKTDIHEKRIGAIGAVRNVINQYLSDGRKTKRVNLEGYGSYLHAVVPSTDASKVVKFSAKGHLNSKEINEQIAKRGGMKALLTKSGIAPQTIHVQTGSNDYLVQDKVKTVGERFGSFTNRFSKSNENFAKEQSQINTLKNKINKAGFEHEDVTPNNLAFNKKGKLNTIDAGCFSTLRELTSPEKRRIDKFRVTVSSAGKFKKGKS